MQTTYDASSGDKVSFYWKVSSESSCDYLEFYIDDTRQDRISGEVDWQKKSYSLSAGSRTLKWRYVKNESSYEGEDTGWVDGLYAGPSSGSLPADDPGDYAEAVDSSLKFTSSGEAQQVIGSAIRGHHAYFFYANGSSQSSEIAEQRERDPQST